MKWNETNNNCRKSSSGGHHCGERNASSERYGQARVHEQGYNRSEVNHTARVYCIEKKRKRDSLCDYRLALSYENATMQSGI